MAIGCGGGVAVGSKGEVGGWAGDGEAGGRAHGTGYREIEEKSLKTKQKNKYKKELT